MVLESSDVPEGVDRQGYRIGIVTRISEDYILINDAFTYEIVDDSTSSLKVGDAVRYALEESTKKSARDAPIVRLAPLRRVESEKPWVKPMESCDDDDIRNGNESIAREVVLSERVGPSEEIVNSGERAALYCPPYLRRRRLHLNHSNVADDLVRDEVATLSRRSTRANESVHGIVIEDGIVIGLRVDERIDHRIAVENAGLEAQTLATVYVCSRFRSTAGPLVTFSCPDTSIEIPVGTAVAVTLKCLAHLAGVSEETCIFYFGAFVVKRLLRVVASASGARLARRLGIKGDPLTTPTDETFEQFRATRERESLALPGVRPVAPPKFVKFRHELFKIPRYVWSTILKLETMDVPKMERQALVKDTLTSLAQPLSIETYKTRFHNLLYLEEIELTLSLREFDLNGASMRRDGNYLVLHVPGLSEKRPSVLVGDRAVVEPCQKWISNGDVTDDSFHGDVSTAPKYEGYIHGTLNSDIYLRFDENFHRDYDGGACRVSFKSSYTTIQRCHHAIEEGLLRLGPSFLFPEEVELQPPQQLSTDRNVLDHTDISYETRDVKWFNPNLNLQQRRAVENILLGVARPQPYVIFGPSGTGKTLTICEAILQTARAVDNCRILVATPSNGSANLLASRIVDCCSLGLTDMVRLAAYHCQDGHSIPAKLLPYCATVELAVEGTSRRTRERRDGIRVSCSANEIARYRIVVGTCSTLGVLSNIGLSKGHFTHVFVDEACQSTEPEIMIVLNLLRSTREDGGSTGTVGQTVLAGDPMQLGPVVHSKIAEHYGLGESFMERLLLRSRPHTRNSRTFESDYDPRLVTKLKFNYRSHPEILQLSNAIFYGNDMESRVSTENSEEARFLERLRSILPERFGRGPPAVVFHGVEGENSRHANSTSWYNTREAEEICRYLRSLYDIGVGADDIGVITPYAKQVECVRQLLDRHRLERPKVCSVEAFQGQERMVVLLSTVRTNDRESDKDAGYNLGFLSSPKRLNVAVTRARALLIIVGNPYCLHMDKFWRIVIDYCRKLGGYTGCGSRDVPSMDDVLLHRRRHDRSRIAVSRDASSLLDRFFCGSGNDRSRDYR